MVGEVLSKYKILEEIGQGGMAVVYRGLDTSLNREVAVKVLHAHLADREESRERFQREAHAVARLRHDNILEIFDYSGKGSKRNFIVMEFIHGPTLKGFLENFALNVPEIGAMIVTQVCSALAHAHATGIIHRDIKPENIMVRDDGVIKLMDFGIAAMVDTQKLTVTGQLLGSPAYMAPEMVTGEHLDFRTDVFSVGILLYRLCVGELPFKGKNPHEVLKRIAEVDLIRPNIANPRVGDGLAHIIERVLQRNPDDRPESIEALREDLHRYLHEMEVEDPRQELTRFFKEPDEYQRNFELVLIENLLEAGQTEMRRANHARAFSLLNRVLAFDPHNTEVKGLLGRLSRQRSIRSLIKIALLVTLIIAAGAAVAWGVQHMRSESDWPAGHTVSGDGGVLGSIPAADGEVGEPGDAEPPKDDAGPEPSPVDATAPRTGPDASAPRPPMNGMRGVARVPPRKRRFVINVKPLIWYVYLDGKKISTQPGTPREIELGSDDKVHQLVLRDDAGNAYPWKSTIQPDTPGQSLYGTLKWHPARLHVTGTPSGAFWQFRSPAYLRRMGSKPLGGPYAIEIRNPQESGVKAKIRVYRNGYRSVERQVLLWPNRRTQVRINLKLMRR